MNQDITPRDSSSSWSFSRKKSWGSELSLSSSSPPSPFLQSAFIKHLCSAAHSYLFIVEKRICPTLEALDGYQVAKKVGTWLPCVVRSGPPWAQVPIPSLPLPCCGTQGKVASFFSGPSFLISKLKKLTNITLKNSSSSKYYKDSSYLRKTFSIIFF